MSREKMLYSLLSQRQFDFSGLHQGQISIMVGEVFEEIAEMIFPESRRIHPAFSAYRDEFLSGVPLSNNGHHALPDLYLAKKRCGLEIKGVQKRSTFKIRINQVQGFQELIKNRQWKFRNIKMVFFRYVVFESLSKIQDPLEMVKTIVGQTELMAVLDFKIIERLIKQIQGSLFISHPYGSIGDYKRWNGGPVFMLNQSFFEDLRSDPEKVSVNLDFPKSFLRVEESKIEDLSFPGDDFLPTMSQKMNFTRLDCVCARIKKGS